jgi:hypothetical protein
VDFFWADCRRTSSSMRAVLTLAFVEQTNELHRPNDRSWHTPADFRAAAIPSAVRGAADGLTERHRPAGRGGRGAAHQCGDDVRGGCVRSPPHRATSRKRYVGQREQDWVVGRLQMDTGELTPRSSRRYRQAHTAARPQYAPISLAARPPARSSDAPVREGRREDEVRDSVRQNPI